jgi:hypothetical protein
MDYAKLISGTMASLGLIKQAVPAEKYPAYERSAAVTMRNLADLADQEGDTTAAQALRSTASTLSPE